ncbi:uncharacterized protein LOC143282466 [Babylonia areolata]|uniref:uncharacterized protein LOC143282466 n=1 Tax=Babylonia areolata TaxID=304850 RepID=UPI003FD28B2B
MAHQQEEQTTETYSYTQFYYLVPEGETYTGDLEGWLAGGEGEGGGGGRLGVAGSGPEAGGGVGGGEGEGGLYHTSSHERGFIHSARIGTVITVLNILLNLLLIVLVLLRRSTRVQFVYQQIVNLALSDLAFSVMVDPFTVYFDLQPWRLAPGYCVAWMVLDAALPFVSFLCLIVLNVDRLLFAISPTLYHRIFRRAGLRGLVFLLPWTLGLGVLVPLWLLTAVAWPQRGICLYGVTKRAAVASAVTSLYVPCVLLIVLSVLILVTIIGGMPQDLQEASSLRHQHQHQHHRHQHQHSPQPPSSPTHTHAPTSVQHVTVVRQGSGGGGGGGGLHPHPSTDLVTLTTPTLQDGGRAGGGGLEAETPEVKRGHRSLVVALCVLNLLTVITQLPYGAISMLEPECVEPSCHSTIKLIQALSWMRSVTFSLHPVCLVLLTRIRQACLLASYSSASSSPYCCCCCRGHEGPDVSQPGVGFPGIVVTPCANSKSDQIELTSINNSVGNLGKGPTTML